MKLRQVTAVIALITLCSAGTGPFEQRGSGKPKEDCCRDKADKSRDYPDHTHENALDQRVGQGGPRGILGGSAPCPQSNVPVVERFLGDSVSIDSFDMDHYFDVFGGPVELEGELNCDFDEEACCWNNVQPPNDQIQFVYASGEPRSDLFELNFRTDEMADGGYALTASPCEESPEALSQIVSCTIPCTDENVKVTLKHWATKNVELQVCMRESYYEDPVASLFNCKTIDKRDSPGPTTIELPPGEMFDIVISAQNFVDKAGDMALIDEVRVDYTLCQEDPETTTTATANITTTPTPEDPDGSKEECESIECNFENGDICMYRQTEKLTRDEKLARDQLAKRLKLEFGLFHVVKGRFKNWITGIHEAGEGQYYAASYLYPDYAAVLHTYIDYGLIADRVIRFRHYEATAGLRMRVCCDTHEHCPFKSDHDVDADDRHWKASSVRCPEGSKRIIFICESVEHQSDEGKKHQGACGIDKIRLYKALKTGGRTIVPACSNLSKKVKSRLKILKRQLLMQKLIKRRSL